MGFKICSPVCCKFLKLTFSNCSKKEIHRALQGPQADLGLASMEALISIHCVSLKHSVEK